MQRASSRGTGRGRRRFRRGAVVVVTTVGLAMLAAGPAMSDEHNRDHGRNPNGDWSTHRDPNADQSSRRQYGDPPGDEELPARFVAEMNGRIVVVSASTGRVERRLTADQAGGGATDPTVGPEGRTVWFSRSDGGCGAHLAFVPAAGGSEGAVPGSGESGPESTPLPRPGRDHLAYARGSCAGPDSTLVVGDMQGLQGHGQLGLTPLAWSGDGAHLMATTAGGGEVHVLDVNNAGAIADDRVLAPADRSPGCRLTVVDFSPGATGNSVAVRRCGPSAGETPRSLVLLNPDGRLLGTIVRLPRGQDFTDRPAFDQSGHSLLFSTVPAEASGAEAATTDVSLWVWRDGDVRRLLRPSPYRHPSWLP